MNLYIFETGELIKIFEKNISDDLLHYYQLYQPTLIILGPSPYQIYQLQGHVCRKLIQLYLIYLF